MRKYVSVTNSLGLGGAERIANFVHNRLLDEYGRDRVSIVALHKHHERLPRVFLLAFIIRYFEALISFTKLSVFIIKNTDVVLVSHMTQANIIARFLKLVNGNIKCVQFIHSNYELKHKIFCHWLTDDLVDRYIFISDHSLNAQKKFFEKKKSRVFHHYVDERVFHYDSHKRSETRKSLNIGSDFLFIVAGRLSKEKNISQIVDFWNETSINSMLLIVGSGPEHALLEKLSNSNPRIKMLPSVKNIQDYYNAADVVISNSPDESYGLVINESLLCGCTVFSKNGAHTDFFKNSFQKFKTYNNMDDLLVLIRDIEREKKHVMSNRSSVKLEEYKKYDILQVIDL